MVRAGPQIAFGDGRVPPYAFGPIGFASFGTETSLDGYGCGTTNSDDAVVSFAGGGGLRVDLSRRRRSPTSLDLGASFVRNGEVSYLREGDILSNPDGSCTLRPVRREAHRSVLQPARHSGCGERSKR